MKQSNVVKINTALSNKPFFIKVEDNNMTIDRIISSAIDTMKNQGNPLEAKQLEDLYKKHQMFNGSNTVLKGSILNELQPQSQQIDDQEIQIFEIDMVSAHAGGS